MLLEIKKLPTPTARQLLAAVDGVATAAGIADVVLLCQNDWLFSSARG